MGTHPRAGDSNASLIAADSLKNSRRYRLFTNERDGQEEHFFEAQNTEVSNWCAIGSSGLFCKGKSFII